MNDTSREIIGEASIHGSPEHYDEFIEYWLVTENDSGFFALLGCPNGKGVVRMLTDHCKALGKTIGSVRVLKPKKEKEAPIMYLTLTEVITTTMVMTSVKKPAARLRREAKRQKKSGSGASECARLLGSVQMAGIMGSWCMRFLAGPQCLQ